MTAGQLLLSGFDPAPATAGPDDLPLDRVTFVVVDLETTGGRATGGAGTAADAITEIAAVKVCGGVVQGEFATLVDPRRSIPARITALTGITADMVRGAPPIEVALPMLLEFAGFDRGAVLVAHNAGFDAGFLAAAAGRCGLAWARPATLCTVRLARRVLDRTEVAGVRLAELVRYFAIPTVPTHRALDDARATVGVLHALLERLGTPGTPTWADLRAELSGVTEPQRRKRTLAAELPNRPGVYLFRGPGDEVLYVGTATDLRRRVGQYFNGADRRAKVAELVGLATRIDHVECAHALEAGVRELRLLAAHAPPYNRRSKFPRRWWWVALSAEPFPRLIVVRSPPTTAVLGPFTARADAAAVAELLARHTGIRTCTGRPGAGGRHRCRPRPPASCPAGADLTADQYAPAAARAAAVITGADDAALAAAVAHVDAMGAAGHYEAAAKLRDRTAAAVRTLWRAQRGAALAGVAELVAAAPDGAGGWQLAVIRHGRLAGAGCAARGVPPLPVLDTMVATAQTVLPEPAPLGGALVEETELIGRWLLNPGVRIVRAGSAADAGWAEPRRAAGRWSAWAATADAARRASELLAEPDPAGEQLLGGAGVDGRGGPGQPVLPRRQPFGAAG